MKITIVTGAFLPLPPIMGGAVEKAWFALGREFVRRGHEVTQISRAMPQFPRSETIEGVRHIRVSGYDTPGSLLWLKALDFFYSLRARGALPAADIVVTNTFWLPLLLRNTRRGLLYIHAARFPKGQMRFYQHCARLQVPSRSVAQAIVAEAPALRSKIAVIPYPRPAAAIETLPPWSARERKILYVGRLHPEKGVHLLIEAMQTGFADWKLVVVGPWAHRLGGGGEIYWRELSALAAKASDRIELRGPIFEADQLAQELRSVRLFVYPSLAERGETFGLAALEAMAQGCAVLVSDLECFRDFIRDGETGFVFDHHARDPVQSLREKLTRVLADESALAQVADKGYRETAHFSLSNVADQFLRDFESLLKKS